MFRKQTLSAIVAGAMSLTLAGYASAQQDNSGGNTSSQQNDRGDRGDRSSRRSFDPAQFRQQMTERMKEMLGSSDDEWKVIEPRLEKVMQLQRDSRGGGMSFMFSRSRDRSGSSSDRSSSQSQSAVARAAADLRSAIQDKSVSADEIAKRLANYRQAKEQAKQDLVKAQADLKELLSQRQEAQLVMMGMLE
jgi:hypothetical protein